jgi:LysR family transcriptional regulator, glycine cleavage system transcriptional activator
MVRRTSSVCCKGRPVWTHFETMRDLPLVALRAFAAVYDSGGVRPAARRLRVTHSSVSRHVRELEAWLGAPLIDKSGAGRPRFTPHGEALGRAALSGFAELSSAVDAVRELRRANSVVIATTASFAARWLMPRLRALQQTHPWIEVSVVVQQSVMDVGEQGADLALRMGVGPWADGASEALMDDVLYPVASRDYWASLGDRRPARALAKARLLHDRDPEASWERWFSAYPDDAVDLRAGARFTSSDLVLSAAAEGLGVALARHRMAQDDVAAGRLIRPLGKLQVELPQAYWLVRRAPAAERVAEAAVVDWLRTHAMDAAARTQ